MTILFFLFIIIAVMSGLGAAFWHVSESENQEKKENEKNMHILSAIVLVAGVALLIAPIIMIIFHSTI